MPEDDQSLHELLRSFLVERRELGDGFWPKPEGGLTVPKDEGEHEPEEPAPAPHVARNERRPQTEPTLPRPPVAKPPAAKPPLADRVSDADDRPPIVAPPRQESLLSPEPSTSQWDGLTLAQFQEEIGGCMKCPLGKTRTNFVFGEGDPDADLIFIGEAPGEDEDMQGRPFVGRAGQLLNKMITAMQLRREDVYIANVLKSRPPNNRSPLPSEIETCLPYLEHQIRLIKPKIICLLGRVAAQALLKSNESLTRMRGRWHEYNGIRVMVTYHPAALLRNPNWKRPAWDDLKKLRKELDGVEL